MTEKQLYYLCPKCGEGEMLCDVKAKQGGALPPTYSYTCPFCGYHRYGLCYEDFVAARLEFERNTVDIAVKL